MTTTDATPAPSLALDGEEFVRVGHRAVEIAAAHLGGIAAGPVFQPMRPEERQALLDLPLPEEGIAPDAILDIFRHTILPHPMGNGHPRFFGWVNSPPAPLGALAELLAAALDPSCAGGDHAAIYLERTVVRWIMELVGFPTEGSMGLLVSGGSMATLTALAAARQWAAGQDGRDVRADGVGAWADTLVLYTTPEAHSSIQKAVELLGLGARRIRHVPIDAAFRMDVSALRAAIAADRAAGLRPFCVVASAGTVGTGAIDPLDAIADVCAEQDLWLHVDGAYGAVGILDPAVAARYAGLARVHSLALDPHKWLSVPVECGCVLARDGALLRATFSLVPPYIQTEEGKGFGGLPWYSEYGFQQTRGFRALKLWMVMQHAGRAGLAAHVARHNALALHLARLIADAPDLELMAPVTLSIVCFRYVPDNLRGDDARLDELNKRIMQAVQAGGEAFITNAVLDGRFCLRACILHYATTEEDIAALVEIVRRTGSRCAAAMAGETAR
jgi:aromatic-L-amino-acid decarboxylase